MSKAALAIALFLLIALSGAGIFLLTTPAPTTIDPITLLPTIQPERVTTLTIGRDTYTRDGSAWKGANGWPVRTDRVRALLRSLSGMRGDPSQTARATNPVAITLTMSDGAEHTITLDRRAFAGETVAIGEAGSIDADAALLELLPSSRNPWVATTALPGFDPLRIVRVRLYQGGTGPTQQLRLDARLVGTSRGAAMDDRTVRINPNAVRALGERFRAVEFTPSAGEAVTTQGAAPTRVEFFMSGTGERPEAYVIELQHDALPGSDERGGSVTLPGATRLSGIASGLDPDDLVFDQAVYLARSAGGSKPTDVRTIEIEDEAGETRRYTRALDGWEPERDGEALPAGDAEALLEALLLAEGVPGRANDTDFERSVTIRLYAFDDGLLETIDAGFVEGNVFALRSGPVAWAFPRAGAPAMLRLVRPSGG